MQRARGASAYAWYVLGVLFLVNAFNAIDRSMVNVLVEPIRTEFGFSDGQIGLLSGLGFALLYAMLGIPIARLADTRNRRNILALGLALWSGLTVLTGRATGFFTFLLARAGVGIGEATCYPTAYPLIGDYFPPQRRPLAMAIFQLGVFAGAVAGGILAARLAAAHGWRFAFLAIGAPGLALAALVVLTVREPVRGANETHAAADGEAALPLGAALRTLLRDRRFVLLLIGTTCLTLASASLSSWGSAFMMRLHAVSQADVGAVSAPVGIGGLIGTIGGGLVGSRLAARWKADRAPLAVPLAATLLAVPGIVAFVFARSVTLAVIGGAFGAFGIAVHTGPVVAVAIGLVRPAMRGQASALIVVGQLLLGYGLGPLVVGLISDALAPAHGIQSLRLALGIAPPVLVAIGWASVRAAYRRIGAGAAPAI